MILETEFVSPYDMTLAGRVGQDAAEELNPLASVLPAQTVFGQSIDILKGGNGFNEVAEFRAYDSEVTFGDAGEDIEEVTVKLPALGQQSRISELDQLKVIGSGNRQLLEDMRLKAAKNRGVAVAERMELARGQVLQTGKATINENRFKKEIDFDRDPSMTVTAGTAWGTGTPLTDIDNWVAAYTDLNGYKPERFILSTAGHLALKKNPEVIASIHGDNSAKRVTNAQLNEFLAEEGLPTAVVYDKQVRKAGQQVRIIGENVAIFVPPASADAGVTAWGTTLESLEADYAIAEGERPGIVVAALKSRNPIGIYAHAAAIGLPVLKNANAFMAATVL
ncbi:major capsid protein [Corynebacterium glutamicum]|uniref:major capsid protein n=1 Tax=Corynebacterium glutamicum TaxID=1718 RepID=UPI001B8C9BC1|nr:major capsid protein [Corynebacterium glutamicum]